MQFHPSKNIFQNFLRQFSFHNTILNCDYCFIVSISYMKMWRVMIIAIMIPKKRVSSGIILYLFMQRYIFLKTNPNFFCHVFLYVHQIICTFGAKIMQTNAMKACFRIAECSLSYEKIMQTNANYLT